MAAWAWEKIIWSEYEKRSRVGRVTRLRSLLLIFSQRQEDVLRQETPRSLHNKLDWYTEVLSSTSASGDHRWTADVLQLLDHRHRWRAVACVLFGVAVLDIDRDHGYRTYHGLISRFPFLANEYHHDQCLRIKSKHT